MALYTYAFLQPPPISLPLPQGIQETVQVLGTAQLSALVEPGVAIEELQAEDARLIQAVVSHDRVIRSLFLQTTVLPLRFGTCFVSQQALLDHLNTHQQSYLNQLTQLEGKAEYTLKCIPLTLPEVPVPVGTKGKDYFLSKKRQHQAQLEQQQQQRAQLQQVVATIAQTYPHLRLGEAQSETEKIHLLVAQAQSSQLHHDLMLWQQACPQWNLSLGEALPPYHFVNA